MSPQNIPLKRRADFRRFSRIWQSETIRARAAKPGHSADAAVEVSLRDKQGGAACDPPWRHRGLHLPALALYRWGAV